MNVLIHAFSLFVSPAYIFSLVCCFSKPLPLHPTIVSFHPSLFSSSLLSLPLALTPPRLKSPIPFSSTSPLPLTHLPSPSPSSPSSPSSSSSSLALLPRPYPYAHSHPTSDHYVFYPSLCHSLPLPHYHSHPHHHPHATSPPHSQFLTVPLIILSFIFLYHSHSAAETLYKIFKKKIKRSNVGADDDDEEEEDDEDDMVRLIVFLFLPLPLFLFLLLS